MNSADVGCSVAIENECSSFKIQSVEGGVQDLDCFESFM